MHVPGALRELVQRMDLRSTGKWFVLSALVGVVAGLGAIVFQVLLQLITRIALGGLAGYHPLEPAGDPLYFGHGVTDFASEYLPWAIVGVMTLGGLISGWLVYHFAPEAEGHGTDAAIEAFHHKRGRIRPRIPLVKLLASAVTLGTGGSGGREGPIAQIGAGFGSFLATRLHLSARDRRLMLAAGMGAGVGAIFRAPLAGALFAGEILYRDADFESEAIVPAAIASIVAYSVYAMSLPGELQFLPLFGAGLDFTLGSLLELGPLLLFAFILTAFGAFYVKVFYGAHKAFQRLPVKRHFRPAIGAGLAGLLMVALFLSMGRAPGVLAVLSAGYGIIQTGLADPMVELPIVLLLVIAVGKVLTTSLTIGSGGSGGVFGPSMVIGACIGAIVGQLFHQWMPGVVSQPRAYVIVGMAGFFAGIAHAPFSTIIMVSELTGSYKLLLPTMWVSTLCFLLSRRWTLYEKQVASRIESPAHRGDFIVDILEGIRVADAYEEGAPPVRIPYAMSLAEIVHLLPDTQQSYFPVVDENERMLGIFTANDVRAFLYDESIWQVAIAEDVMARDVLSVTPDDDLNVALRRFTHKNLDELPVLDPEDDGRLVGMLHRKDVISVYNQRLVAQKRAQAEADRADDANDE